MTLPLTSCVALGKTFILPNLSFLICEMGIEMPLMYCNHLTHSRCSRNSGCIFIPSHKRLDKDKCSGHPGGSRQFWILIRCLEDRGGGYRKRCQPAGVDPAQVLARFLVTFVNFSISTLVSRSESTLHPTEQTAAPRRWKEHRPDQHSDLPEGALIPPVTCGNVCGAPLRGSVV